MRRGGPLRRLTRLRPGDKPLRVKPGDYSPDQRRRNTTLSAEPPPPDPRAEQFRKTVQQRDWCCTLAGQWGIACAGPLDVHHVIPRNVAPERVYDPDNATLLCRAHHDSLQDHRYVTPARITGVLGRNGDTVRNGRVVW